MAQTLFTVDVPNGADLAALRTRIVNAFATVYGYQSTITGAQGQQIPNPETKAQFAKRYVAQYVRSIVEQAEAAPAVDTARDVAVTKVRNEVVVS